MKNFLKVLKVSLVITIFISLMNLFIFNDGDFSLENVLTQIILSFIFSFGLTAANSYYYDGVSLRYDWEKEPKKRLWVGALGSIVITLVVFAVLRYLMFLYFKGYSVSEFIANEHASAYVIALIITLFVSLFIHAFYFYRALQKREVKQQKIIAGTASARFDALKNQLDPHFLFNSLNVLTSLIEEDPDAAQKFTTSLSKVYRYVLEQKNKDLVTVNEELDFARTYVRLLKMRFEDSIVFDIPENASNPEAKIVPLSLQLLLENAVKHNVVTSSKPLHLKVYEEDGMLVVKNNLQEKKVVKKSSGVGLQNIRQRYSILTDRQVEIEKNRDEFSVKLPMLTQQITVMETDTHKDHIEEKRYLKAKERVEAIKGFYGNLTAYLIVIPILWWLNFRTTDFLWAFFPTLGWGFGLTMHALEAFGYNPLWGKRWEEKKIKELMEKEDF
ncbi:2TM domain-containing protein [Flagellimonas lutaonensis]|uniref:Signal transduction histidine kinase, LytS n=1 Tax=Flagellimonas lutaonensis TaxID=516051 RepID=A0A0D5YNQ1_9FLAO|nr:2TM domain-containing protein [Allomuricauda lutaonensis]AKA33852.1 Signal transduction histidine kinase, LytS [Allomuricauda lutaonensis]